MPPWASRAPGWPERKRPADFFNAQCMGRHRNPCIGDAGRCEFPMFCRRIWSITTPCASPLPAPKRPLGHRFACLGDTPAQRGGRGGDPSGVTSRGLPSLPPRGGYLRGLHTVVYPSERAGNPRSLPHPSHSGGTPGAPMRQVTLPRVPCARAQDARPCDTRGRLAERPRWGVRGGGWGSPPGAGPALCGLAGLAPVARAHGPRQGSVNRDQTPFENTHCLYW